MNILNCLLKIELKNNLFCLNWIQVLYIKALLILGANKRNEKMLGSCLSRFISNLLYEFWQIAELQEAASVWSLVFGVSGETRG